MKEIQAEDQYNPTLDLARGVDACYESIRERIKNGSKPWLPPDAGAKDRDAKPAYVR
jgi:hypothetical protein